MTDRQWVWLIDLAGKDCVEVLAFLFNRQRFDRSNQVPMQMHFDRSNLRECEVHAHHALFVWWPSVLIKLPSGTIRVGKGTVAMPSLEPGVSCSPPVLHALKEPIKRFIQAKKHILKDMRSNFFVFWSHLLDIHQFDVLGGQHCRALLLDRGPIAALLPLFYWLKDGMCKLL